jgi:hypothetical protein
MRPTQGRAATKNQLQRPRLERGDCSQRLYDLEILLDKPGLGSPKYAWVSSRSWTSMSPFKDQLRVSVPELSRKTALDPHDRVHRDLR